MFDNKEINLDIEKLNLTETSLNGIYPIDKLYERKIKWDSSIKLN
jgi:hypothetical protein